MAGALIFHTYEDFCRQAGEHIFTILKTSLLHKKRSSLVLAGGSTPAGVYRYLAENYNDLHWEDIDFFLGDDRCVPEDHEDSNYRMIQENFLSRIDYKEEQIYTIDQTLPPDQGAELYHKRVKNYLETNRLFDLVLLGMGPDGHTASLFPHYPELEEKVKCAVATKDAAPLAPPVRRITMTYPALNRCSNLIYLIRGKEKKKIMNSVLGKKSRFYKSHDYPVSRIEPEAGKSYWYYID
jgi:6-phosphogluconolactonase